MLARSVDVPSNETLRRVLQVMGCRSTMAAESGGIACQSAEDMRVCRSVLSLMIKQMGRNLLTGGNVMNVSFPIQCCQPKSLLEIGSAMGQYFHLYMPRAAAASDPVERMSECLFLSENGLQTVSILILYTHTIYSV